ncbi:IMP cyclohydrolase [Anaerolactibacter massiliensis]|uniref:IMP cyclohydrolase n=1 Tax=Anaerolactibacter massiliensis TaxID=2044573 RepID=UPI000CF963A1|nr:IMP cyclohydrolase [Anaerolactibacter massiliensis]MCI6745777.1 IMP cyclohydrolase [Anaerolactibacter massiliensis]
MAEDLFSYLRGIDYPGRGIVIGRTPCGKRMRIGYFIMGRSSNSRNRVFVTDDDGIRTQAFDPSKMEDPSLIIYAPVRVFRDQTIVTNGDQTDTIYQALEEGKTFEDALFTRTFEPDGPNYTPRISALVKGSSYRMSILKSDEGNPASTLRQFFDYSEEQPGFGRIIHTYAHNGSPIPSFRGEPVRWEMVHEPFDQFSQHLWEALNPDNKVSLFTRQITIETGETETKIFNRNEEEK